MRYLFDHWESFVRQLEKARAWLFLFDYDGTLAPMAESPSQAVLSETVRHRLQVLSHYEGVFIGVVSGRSLADVQRMVRLPNLIYVGNHGLEITNKGWSFEHPGAQSKRQQLQTLTKTLKHELSEFPGAWVEDKGLTLSVHYRLVKGDRRASKIKMLRHRVDQLAKSLQLSVRFGKEVMEIAPELHWNKGTAVNWLRKIMPEHALTVYLGDDRTDEDAFRALKGKGIAIRVGRRKSSLEAYYLRDPSDVAEFLNRLAILRPAVANSHG